MLKDRTGMKLRALVLLSTVAVLAACSSSSKTSSGTTTTKASGPPIKVYTILLNQPSEDDPVVAGVNAGVKAVNAKGGIKGRQLVDVQCEGGDANSTATCARNAVADPSVLALAGTINAFGSSITPVIEAANLPSIGESVFGSTEFKSPMIFPTDGGAIANLGGGVPVCLNDLKGSSVAVVLPQLSVAAQETQLINTFLLKPYGKQLKAVVTIPTGTVDLTSPAAQVVSNNPSCVLFGIPMDLAVQMVKALQQQGFKGHIILDGSSWNTANLTSSFGTQANGLVVSETYDISSPLYSQFLSDMKSSAGSNYAALATSNALKGWLSIQIFAHVAGQLSSPSRSSLLAALQSTDYNTDGLTQSSLNFANRNAPYLGGTAPNLIAPYVFGYTMTNGNLVPISGKWENIFTPRGQ